MARTRSLWVTILIGVLAILFTIAVLVAWNVMFTRYYVLSTRQHGIPDLGAAYWLTLSGGSLFLVLVGVALVMFLVANVRQALYVNQQKQFIDSVTHELKSPLASILLSLETLETRQLEPEMQARFIGMMKKDIYRLREFIDHVLVAGRLDQDERELHYESAVLRDLLAECAGRIRQRYDLPAEAIRLEDPEAEGPMMLDRVALGTVLLNLLDNAVKYSGRPVQVVVRHEESGTSVRLSVRDQGIGITRKEIRRVFQRFYRVDRRGRPAVRGTGLGLYVVSTLVKRMGGRIAVTSEGEERGSVFVVELPRREPAPDGGPGGGT